MQLGHRWPAYSRPVTTLLAATVLVLAGLLDYFTGNELRVYPAYFAPVALAGWGAGRGPAVGIAVLSAACWLVANYLGGMSYSQPWMWAFNSLMQLLSFSLVAYLIATVRQKEERERQLARTDPLTGLLNGRAFFEDAQRELERSRRHGRSLTLAFLDLDNFKKVNDSLGHLAGDKLLQEIATALRSSTRPADLLARLGGDEFAILLAEVNPETARSSLERLHGTMSERIQALHREVTVSLGARCFRRPPPQVEGLLHQADVLMYAAKQAGKNRLHLEIDQP